MTEKRLTQLAATTTLNRKGMTLSKRDGEYRVNFAGTDGTEDNAYYTTDLEDAVASGVAMSDARTIRDEDKWPNWPRLWMKNAKSGDLGVLIIGGNHAAGKFVLFCRLNVYRDIPDDAVEQRFGSEHEVIAAGWRID